MAENVYEGMFILDSNRYARDPSGVSGMVEKLVKEIDGSLLVSRLWEERRLAYPIKGHRKGTYWLFYFRADSEKIAPLNRQCQINDEILRHLFLKIDPRIVDALVSHADQSETKSSPAPEAKSDKDTTSKDTTSKGDADAKSTDTEAPSAEAVAAAVGEKDAENEGS